MFSEYNSGTYNNQYPVINVGKFVPGAALPKDLLWVVEQVPGLIVAGDATELLALGHFPSYNVPYWREIYDISGYKQQIERRRAAGAPLGELSGLDWQLAPRAKIFRRDAGKVTDMDSFLDLMRSNDYKNDPVRARAPRRAARPPASAALTPNAHPRPPPVREQLPLERHLLARRPRGLARRLPRRQGVDGVNVGVKDGAGGEWTYTRQRV